jgi:predicted DNA binding CopG/RHH family protein
MKRIYQESISSATKELIAENLKSMMESPKNNELINAYRDAKNKMLVAETQQAMEEFVQDFVGSDGYKKWLANELKKDEKRKKKRIPSDDLQRVKLYISQLKTSLPAIIPTIEHFAESTDKWGRLGMWRLQQYGYLSGLALVDGDHVRNPEERIEEWLKRVQHFLKEVRS